jgi:hypothetical protein
MEEAMRQARVSATIRAGARDPKSADCQFLTVNVKACEALKTGVLTEAVSANFVVPAFVGVPDSV